LDQQLAAPTNDELVEKLRRSGMLSCDRLVHAMKMVPRDAFVPEGYRQEALLDAPIRVEEHDFNISAPHMHSVRLFLIHSALGLQLPASHTMWRSFLLQNTI
jgi:protein-L-isoaspartate O-methyltransferase